MGRLHDTGPDTLPAARRDGSADLQLVEFVRASGRSRASSRSHHFPASPAVGHRAQDPARRAGDADDQQHAWPARQGTPRLCPHRWLPGGPAAKCRAVKPAGKMVPHPQRSPPTLPARAAASATAAPQPRMNTYHGLQRSCHHRQRDRPTAGFKFRPHVLIRGRKPAPWSPTMTQPGPSLVAAAATHQYEPRHNSCYVLDIIHNQS